MNSIRIVLALALMTLSSLAKAQDTLWVRKIDGKPFITHSVLLGEDLFLLSKKYTVPPAVLADVNNLNFQNGLAEGTPIWIPVDNYNFIRVEGIVKSQALFYKVKNGETLKDISRLTNVAQSALQMWNHLPDQTIRPNQILKIGWVAYDKTQVPFPKSAPKENAVNTNIPTKPEKIIVKADTNNKAIADTEDSTETPSPYEELYEKQVAGNAGNSETGAAVFYTMKVKVGEGVYYAFHNTAARGTIIKVTNPANDHVIYAKVIGPIPDLSDYHNSIISLSSNAAKGLMAQERRMFCKIEYR